jgi:TRAP-type C4-dicarboxylate transport system permease small subunit
MKSKNGMIPAETGITSVNKWLSFVAAFFGALIMIIATVDVITAKFFATSVPGGKHLIEEFNAVVVFLALAYVTQERGHIRITLFEQRMPARVAHAFRLVGHALGALIVGFCTWRAVALVLDSIAQHSYKYGAIDFPLWPFQAVVVLGCALMTITFILFFIRELRLRDRDKPGHD